MNCPYCDAALTRCAVLSLELQQVAREAHAAGKHPGPWDRCALQPCLRIAVAINKAGLESQRD